MPDLPADIAEWSSAELALNMKLAWHLWSGKPPRNSWDIAKALKVSEPVALRLLDLARRSGNVN